MGLRVEHYKTWEQLKEAALRYEALGIKTEVKGWDAIRANKLTIYGDFEEAADGH